MIYIIDTNVFRVVEHYYPDRFASFWSDFNSLTASSRIISVREVYREILRSGWKDYMKAYIDKNIDIFQKPCSAQMEIVAKIMKDSRFKDFVRKKQWLDGAPVADPFLVAAGAILQNTIVVSQENSKMPEVCTHFGVKCIQIRELMEREQWQY